MKKRIIKTLSIALALTLGVLSVIFVAGCGFIERNYERINARTIATIASHTQNAYVNRNAVIDEDGEYIFLENTEFDTTGRATQARRITRFGDPYLRNGQEIVFDIFTGHQIIINNNNPNYVFDIPAWGSVNLNDQHRNFVFAFERDENGVRLRRSLAERDNAIVRETNIPVPFTSPEIRIYRAQLVSYFNQFAGQFLNQNMTVEQTVDQIMGILVNQQLVLIEADKQMFVGNIYWTEESAEEIQRAIYHAIDMQILRHKNTILERRGQPHLITPENPPPSDFPPSSLPVPPPPPEPEPEPSPRLLAGRDYFDNGERINRNEYRWHDGWYLNDAWYLHGEWIEDFVSFRFDNEIITWGAFASNPEYLPTFPGMHGDADTTQSLANEAMRAFLEEMLENAQHIIGLSEYNFAADQDELNRQRSLIAKEAAFLRTVRDTMGIQFVYPLLGNTFTFKMLFGIQSVNQVKLEKLQEFVASTVNINEDDIRREANNRLQDQRTRFGGTNNIPVNRQAVSSAISAGELMLYMPSNRYLWVKHILLPIPNGLERMRAFDESNNWGTPDAQRERREEYRLRMVMDMNVYRNINGERDFARPFSYDFVIRQIYNTMHRYRNSPHLASEAFQRLVFEWNNDPGMFNNRTGYQVVYRLDADENETFMQEFADAAREFRTRRFSLGQLLTEDDGITPRYAITDHGVHIMFYASDPFYFRADGTVNTDRTMSLNCFTTPAQDERVRDIIAREVLEQRQAGFYNNWEADFVVTMRRLRIDSNGREDRESDRMLLEIDDDTISRMAAEWHEEIFGR